MKSRFSIFNLLILLLLLSSCNSLKRITKEETNQNSNYSIYFIFDYDTEQEELFAVLKDTLTYRLKEINIDTYYARASAQTHAELQEMFKEKKPNDLVNIIFSDEINENKNITAGRSNTVFDILTFDYKNKHQKWKASLVIKNIDDINTIVKNLANKLVSKYSSDFMED